jgi:hypothetical protein
MIQPYVVLDKYWEKIVNYYYDNVHFDELPTISIRAWLIRNFGGHISPTKQKIYFDTDAQKTFFIMRWS